MKKLIGLLVILSVFTLSSCTDKDDPIIKDPIDQTVDCDVNPTDPECVVETTLCTDQPDTCIIAVEEMLLKMTLSEKAAQMVQAERGSITPAQVEQYGIGSILSGGGSHPSSYDNSVADWYNMYAAYQQAALDSSSEIPLIYGIDAVHGNNNLYGATIFPHNIGLGAANDPNLVYDISKATAEEMLITGINWTFAPALSVVQNIRWGRTYEGYSENPLIHQNLTAQAILGFEENGVSATAKHFFGDGGTSNGQDQGNSVMLTDEVKEIHLAPYIEAIEADVDTIMISYSSVNGTKMHGSHYWITEVLKEEMGFDGFIISDWNAIHQLPGDFEDQVVLSINAGVDMLMEPYDWENTISTIISAVNGNKITMQRIDDAVRRILQVKYERGLFTDPLFQLEGDYLYNEDHQALAREAVQKSLVLLKNDQQSLPLAKTENIYIVGPASDHVGLLCGGWTTYWQGNTSSDIGVGTSILDAMAAVLSTTSGTIVNNIAQADTVIVVLSEEPYAEGNGDNGTLTLTSGNASAGNAQALQIAQDAHNQGKNVVGILISGRPLLLGNSLQYFNSFVAAWLPGTEGGNGISDVLFGDVDFTGTLSFTWPSELSQVGYTSNRSDYNIALVLYPFGYGLTYQD